MYIPSDEDGKAVVAVAVNVVENVRLIMRMAGMEHEEVNKYSTTYYRYNFEHSCVSGIQVTQCR